MDNESIQRKFSEIPLLAGVDASSAVYLHSVISAVENDDKQAALDEIFRLSEDEIPNEHAESYLLLAQNVCAACEYAEGWVLFNKEHVRLLLENGREPEASVKIKGLQELLPGDEEINTLSEKLTAGLKNRKADVVKEIRSREEINRGFSDLVQIIGKKSKEQLFKLILKNFNGLAAVNKTGIENYITSYPFWGELNAKKAVYDTFRNRARIIHEHLEDFKQLHERLADARSKNVLYAILAGWVNFDSALIDKYAEHELPEYYHPDIFPQRDNEVFVDLGAFTGDSAVSFINTYGMTYKRIYCYEISQENYQTLAGNFNDVPNVELRQKAAGAAVGVMYVKYHKDLAASRITDSGDTEIEVVSIDDDIKEPVTFIKMDIEGAEKDALRGCERHIRENKPRLAICTYHGYEDIYAIPKLIDGIQPGYKFYMRYHGGNRTPTEYSLLAVWDGEKETENVVIVGLHQYGEELYRRVTNAADKYKLVCFCDTTGQYVNTTHFGIKVVSVDLLAELYKSGGADKIIVAFSGYAQSPSTSEVFKQLKDAGIDEKVYLVPPWFYDGAYDFVQYSMSPFDRGEEIPLSSALVKADMSKAVLGFIAPISNMHCNNSCKACVMASPLAEAGFTTLESYRKDIKRLKELYWHICRFRITGGESLLHPDIAEMVKITREAFPATGLAVQTNAVLLLKDVGRFKHLFKVMRDTRCGFQISVYKPVFEHREKLDEILRSNGIQWHWGQVSGKPVESFSVWRELSPKNDMQQQYDECYNTKYCHALLDGYAYPCGMPIPAEIIEKHFDVKFEGLTERIEQMRHDIHSRTMNGWELVDYLQKPTPACEYCCFEKQKHIQWEQCPRSEAKPEDYFL